MNPYILERVTTKVALSGVAAIAGVVATLEAGIQEKLEPWTVVLILGGFLVAFFGALVLAFSQWLRRAGANVPRDPARIGEQLNRLGKKLDGIDRRLARLEGYVNQPVVIRDGGNGV